MALFLVATLQSFQCCNTFQSSGDTSSLNLIDQVSVMSALEYTGNQGAAFAEGPALSKVVAVLDEAGLMEGAALSDKAGWKDQLDWPQECLQESSSRQQCWLEGL